MRLHDLLQLVALEEDGDPDMILANLAVIRGSQAWGHCEPGWVWENGEPTTRLTPDLEIEDRYVRLDCVAHYPIWCLFFSESQHDLERQILSEGGYFNSFTTYVYAFVDGNLKRFECSYRDHHGLEHRFNKASQLEDDGFGATYLDRRLRWLT